MTTAPCDPAWFFQTLYGADPEGFLVLWTRQDKRAHWFDATDTEAASRAATQLAASMDVYFGVGLQAAPLGPSARGTANGVVALPGLFADIDVASNTAHARSNLPRSTEEAAALCHSFGLPPSLLIHSGYGLQAWWLFREPWIIETDAERDQAATLLRSFQAALNTIAASQGWKLDTTHDLARVLRPPGTFNRKDPAHPRPVTVDEYHPDHRFNPADFEPFLDATMPISPLEDIQPQQGLDSLSNTELDALARRLPPIRHALEHPTTLTYNDWLATLCYLSPFANGRDLAHQISSLDPARYNTAVCDKKFDEAAKLAAKDPPISIDIIRRLRTEAAAPDDKPAPRFRLVPFRDINPDFATPQLVQGILEPGSLAVIFGASNAGKSFIALDIAFHIATGRRWFGRPTALGSVVYIAAESPGSILRRAFAIKRHHRLESTDVPLYVLPQAVNLIRSDHDTAALVSSLKALPQDPPLRLVIVDTVAQALAGGDENSFETMGLLAARLGQLRDATGATFLAVHHAGKDLEKGARGHSSLKAAIDTEIEVRSDGDIRIAQLTKSRDSDVNQRVGFELHPIDVATGPDGKPIQIPIVVHLSAADCRKPLSGRALDIFAALTKELDATPNGVTLDRWRAAFFDLTSGRLTSRTAKDTFYRGYQRLIGTWVFVGLDGRSFVTEPPTNRQTDNEATCETVGRATQPTFRTTPPFRGVSPLSVPSKTDENQEPATSRLHPPTLSVDVRRPPH